jgi:hypothetical protein
MSISMVNSTIKQTLAKSATAKEQKIPFTYDRANLSLRTLAILIAACTIREKKQKATTMNLRYALQRTVR